MKLEPACVLRISLSRKFLRSCTSGASWEPNVAVAMRHAGAGADVVVLTDVVADVVLLVALLVAVVVAAALI